VCLDPEQVQEGDNLVNLSNIKPIILDVNTMLDVTSSSFDDFDKFF
jgi:hypothetical protein